MSNLKTTKEERARLREEAPCIVVEFGTNNDGYTGTSPRNEEVISILDDLDTLEAAVEAEFAERKRVAEALRECLVEANEKALEHLEARMRAEAERDALREVASEFFTDEELAIALAKVPR